MDVDIGEVHNSVSVVVVVAAVVVSVVVVVVVAGVEPAFVVDASSIVAGKFAVAFDKLVFVVFVVAVFVVAARMDDGFDGKTKGDYYLPFYHPSVSSPQPLLLPPLLLQVLWKAAAAAAAAAAGFETFRYCAAKRVLFASFGVV